MKKYFETKEQYLEYKAHWASIVNNKENHPTRDKTYGTKYRGKLYVIHHFINTLICGKDPRTIFAETNKKYVGPDDYWEYKSAYDYCCSKMEKILEFYDTDNSWKLQHKWDFELFGGTLPIQSLRLAWADHKAMVKEKEAA